MSMHTKIQWCDSTINPTMGCEGCELWSAKVKKCYAGMLHVRRGGKTKGFSSTFEELTFWPGRMAQAARWRDLAGTPREDKPWLDGLPRLIFVSDMSDALSSVVPFEFLRDEIIANVASPEGRRHRWLWLTKRPDRMAKFSDFLLSEGIGWPGNVWAATSITTQATTSRIRHLLRVGDDRTIRFLSVEPQYESLNLSAWLPRIDWVIQGGESGHGANPFHIEWALDLIRQCRTAKVSYFLKQLGRVVHRSGQRIHMVDHHGGDWSEWPEQIRVREMPIIPTDVTPDIGGRPPKGQKTAAELSDIARRAWAARRANEERRREESTPSSLMTTLEDLKQRRSDAARKAWQTRRERGG